MCMSCWVYIKGKVVIPGKVDPHTIFGKETYEISEFLPAALMNADKQIIKAYRHEECQKYYDSLDGLFEHPEEYMYHGSEGTPHLEWITDKENTTIWMNGALRDVCDVDEVVEWFKSKLPSDAKLAYVIVKSYPKIKKWSLKN